MLTLTFCDANIINLFFCDMLLLLQLFCTSTHVNELVISIVVGINIIFVSYGLIFSSILHIKSMEERSKALSTCSSHIISVSLFFGSGAFVYLKPSSAGSKGEGKISSVFYINTIPLLYPLIYSLRNKDIILAQEKTPSMRQF